MAFGHWTGQRIGTMTGVEFEMGKGKSKLRYGTRNVKELRLPGRRFEVGWSRWFDRRYRSVSIS